MGQGIKKSTIILHLSDLHFGWDRTEIKGTDRVLALNGLSNRLEELEPEWKPNVLCLTGDIGWRGGQNDYHDFKVWLSKLLHILGLSTEAVFLCPGNHDLKRDLAKMNSRPSTAKEADEVLSNKEIPKHFQKPFEDYIAFCRKIDIPPYKIGDKDSYLFGVRTLGACNYICINSAWFSKDDDDKGKLWIGLPLIKHLEANNQIPSPKKQNEWPISIALIHHPREWLHDEEIRTLTNRKNTFDYMSERCHLILSGHTHGEVRKADQFAEGAWHLSGGAAFAGASHFNSFRLIRIEDESATYRSFEFDPRSTDNCWQQKGGASELSFRKAAGRSLIKYHRQSSFDFQAYRSRAEYNANRLIEIKSRALKPFGKLPEMVPLQVSLEIEIRPARFSPKGKLISKGEKERTLLPLFEAARQHRRTLLLGDLGAGKSTLAGYFVIETMKANDRLVSCLIPARALRLPRPFTMKALLQKASEYFNGQIAPALDPIDLESLLKEGIEFTIVVDGLDEVTMEEAASILNQLGALVDHWPCVQVLATGRPVELQGVNYGDWKLLSAADLIDEERFRLFEEEAVSDGKPRKEAKDIANLLLKKLKSTPSLYFLANSPLSIRLLYPSLSEEAESVSVTLGDLISKLIRDRMGQWAAKDHKKSATPNFENEFPDIESRTDLLAMIALKLGERSGMLMEEALMHIKSFGKARGASNENILAKEALAFFEQSGLVAADDQLQFTIKPFFEYLSGVGLTHQWRQSTEIVPWLKAGHWRIVSFAAAAIRRQGLIEELRPRLAQFIEILLSEAPNTAAASYIVSESKDKSLAKIFINNTERIGPRPLHVFWEERQQSAKSIAESIILANQVGFDWFFSRYLDPRYPFVFAGSAVTEAVFQNWAYLKVDSITEHEKNTLKTLVRPHVDAGTFQLHKIIPILAILTPEAFTLYEKLWFCTRLLNTESFATRAEEMLVNAFRSGHEQVLNNILLKTSSIPAANLWLKLNPNRPPSKIVKTAVKALGASRVEQGHEDLVENCILRIGQESWKRFLRWCLFDGDSQVSAGASIGLYKLGERDLFLLGEPLLRAMHDGSYVPEAEKILRELISGGSDEQIRWLTERVSAKKAGLIDNAHSGWWRILLSQIQAIGERGTKLLASCLGSIGPFLLPRYPEVRQGFKTLLEGLHGHVYHKELRERLFDIDPRKRHGAALILLINDPQNESQALEIIIRAVSAKDRSSWDELYGFLLSLPYGPTVLSHIESKLIEFDSLAETLALTILKKNGFQLNDANYGKLVRGLLGNVSLYSRVPDLEKSIFAETDALKHLKTVTEKGIDWLDYWAANKILKYHSQNLNNKLKARCKIIIIEGSLLDIQELNREIEQIKLDPTYYEIVKEVSADITQVKGRMPLLDLVRKAIGNSAAWEDVVWRLLCDDSGYKSERDSAGQWLLDYGRANLDQGKAIGKVAEKLLDDPRVKQTRFGETVQWLAMLADEFIGLSENTIENAIQHGHVIKEFITCALIARLGRVPEKFDRRRKTEDVPSIVELERETLSSESFDRLQELARESDKLHPDVCNVLEHMILHQKIPIEIQNALAREGCHGIFIASAFSFVFGRKPNPSYIIPVLLNYSRPVFEAQDPCLERLIRTWRNGQLIQIVSNSTLKAELIKIFDEALETSQSFDTYILASQLLSLKGNLTKPQVAQVLDQYANNPDYLDHYGLSRRLAEWISQGLDDEIKDSILHAVKRGISTLNMQPWDDFGSRHFDPCKFLLLPLIYWFFTNNLTEESVRVFWRGLKLMITQPIEKPHRIELEIQPSTLQVLEKLEPILSLVPKAILNQALIAGDSINDPVVKSLTRLFVVIPTYERGDIDSKTTY